jgi:hypothetical protein
MILVYTRKLRRLFSLYYIICSKNRCNRIHKCLVQLVMLLFHIPSFSFFMARTKCIITHVPQHICSIE